MGAYSHTKVSLPWKTEKDCVLRVGGGEKYVLEGIVYYANGGIGSYIKEGGLLNVVLGGGLREGCHKGWGGSGNPLIPFGMQE